MFLQCLNYSNLILYGIWSQSSASDSHSNQSHSVEASYLVLTKSHKLEEQLTERVNQYHLIVVIQI